MRHSTRAAAWARRSPPSTNRCAVPDKAEQITCDPGPDGMQERQGGEANEVQQIIFSGVEPGEKPVETGLIIDAFVNAEAEARDEAVKQNRLRRHYFQPPPEIIQDEHFAGFFGQAHAQEKARKARKKIGRGYPDRAMTQRRDLADEGQNRHGNEARAKKADDARGDIHFRRRKNIVKEKRP